jgi:putative ABC transport system permease protein
MALILPDVPALRLRLSRLWSRVSQLLHKWPRFSLARVRAAARTSTAMPLGAQQLKRQRTSTLLSLAGVTASLLVIFAQLGIERAVYESSVRLHRMVAGDLVVVPWGFKSLQLHAEVPVAVTDIVATNSAVATTSPFWFGVMSISHPGMPTSRRIAWYAIDPERPAIDVPGLRENLYKLRETRRILFDRDSRPYFGNLAELADAGKEVTVLGPPDNRGLLRQLFVVGNFAVGPNVLNDGAILMSEDTMAEVFGAWWSDRPAFISIQLVPGADVVATRQQLNRALIGRGEAITVQEFEKREKAYWSGETPVGYITDLGFVMGVMIGMVFIYYAQYQIIRFYLPEYAILKSLGYGWWFFLFMIGQIGAAIITPAFILSFTLGRVVYGITEAAMHLGMIMGLREMVVALVACVIMTVVSSLFAIRRLWKVDPIMLFE